MEKERSFIDEMDRDDGWLKAHMEEIVDQYAHKVIAILDFEVPSGEEFECLL